MKILVIEDEVQLSNSMISYLRSEGHNCEAAYTFSTAIEKIGLYQYDCVLVDLNLPDGNGLDVVKFLKKEKSAAGIIIITVHNSLDDKISGLETGADDYLSKPFHLAELSARVNSVIRRVNFKGDTEIITGNILIKTDERQVFVNESLIELTKKEFDILMLLVSNTNKVLTKETLAEYLWGEYTDSAVSLDFVYAHIKNIRKKLQEKNAYDCIQTIYGVGYKFIKS